MPSEKEVIAIQKGQAARLIGSEITDIVVDMQDNIINRIISRFRSGELTDTDLRGAVGELSGIRGLVETLEARIRRADSERK